LREYCPRAFGTWAIFPQLREIRLTIDLDASHYLYKGSGCKNYETSVGFPKTTFLGLIDSPFVHRDEMGSNKLINLYL